MNIKTNDSYRDLLNYRQHKKYLIVLVKVSEQI